MRSPRAPRARHPRGARSDSWVPGGSRCGNIERAGEHFTGPFFWDACLCRSQPRSSRVRTCGSSRSRDATSRRCWQPPAPSSELFKWTTIPQTLEGMAQYVATAMQWQAQGTALGFATVRREDGMVVGSTRFFLIERWAWPAGERACRGGRLRDRLHLDRAAGDPQRRQHRGEAPHARARLRSVGGAPGVLPHRRAQRALAQCAAAHRRALRGRAARTPPVIGLKAARLGALLDHRERVAAGACAPAGQAGREASAPGLRSDR